MTDQNPYSAPDAPLDVSTEEPSYQPAFFSFNGRIGRLRYLAYSVGATIILMVVAVPVIISMMGGMASAGNLNITGNIMWLIFSIPYIVITITYGKRRFNDLNRSGWWSILLLVPYLMIIPAIYLVFFPGNQGSNNHGPRPVANTTGVIILALSPILIAIVGIVAAVAIPMFVGASQ